MFSCVFCEISENTFSDTTPPVAASINVSFKVIAGEEKAVTLEMSISWWETLHGAKSSRQV